jgi:hypothetical protein
MLKVAKRRGEFPSDIGAVMPDGFESGYQPKKRFLTGPEAQGFARGAHPRPRRSRAFILATGARWGETDRATGPTSRPPLSASCSAGPRPSELAARTVPIVGAGHDHEHVDPVAQM